jgi:Endosomal/lysosomal potassium channel TMEM175
MSYVLSFVYLGIYWNNHHHMFQACNRVTGGIRLIKGAVEIYYPGLSHGLTATHPDIVNRDLLAFCKQGERKAA